MIQAEPPTFVRIGERRNPIETRPRVALLESRLNRELARLIERQGGAALCVPALREIPTFTPAACSTLIDELERGEHELVVFLTGVSVSLLFESADAVGRRAELVNALKHSVTVCRGPKPTAALRGFGVPAAACAQEPYTTAELIDVLAAFELERRSLLVLHCGERSETLAETLKARGARVSELWLYRWLMPEDTRPLEALVERIVSCEVDALVITCQIQFRFLLETAIRMGQKEELLRALRENVVVGAVGPVCAAALTVHGVPVGVMPEHPKMGPLSVALLRQLSAQNRTTRSRTP
jgi:uroporphyrinogen-III synthase